MVLSSCLTALLLFGVQLTVKYPEAIDVYRGNTVLKINCDIIGNDTIVNDSTVIFK